ncbi:SDR family oxidoreductase [Bacillus sp. DNRA2]|uniref:SDR family oxidoreductase n=1 Tax=Bacillus sp. DNRA2 TaxID=2723053 RepID=UPI00145E54A5|nr:SDR family oxidoreductase [Bacillus sp. DNRA2]NMD70917.1 SDR family oxidoreductase [Bacillus sp. DNRA2]
MTTVLVTGSTGNIGSFVVDHLLKREVKVKAAVTNFERGKQIFNGKNLNLIEFDFKKSDTYKSALAEVDKIFLVRPPQLASPKEDMLPFLKEAKKAGVQHIVFVSLMGVENNPVVPHRKIEGFIRDLGFKYTFLRPSFFMQNLNTTHLDDVVKRNELFMPVGSAKTSFIDTRDIAEVAAICITETEHENMAYTLTGNEAITYFEAADIMTEVLGRNITYCNPRIFEFRRTIMKRGTPKNFANVMTMLYVMTRFGTAEKITETTENLLKRKPITFREYVEDFKEDFQKKNYENIQKD